MGKKSERIPIPLYYMGLHYGICAGPVDELVAIDLGEKRAWSGNVSTYQAIPIAQGGLFGGVKQEGGAAGVVHYLPGGTSQILPDSLASRFGLTGLTCPGFRGISSLFFVGTDQAGNVSSAFSSAGVPGASGFYWSANTPYLKGAWAKVRRAAKGLNAAIQSIGRDANPAHIVFECLTNADWGMGASPSIIDIGNFETVAQTLFDEGFGLSMIWTRQSNIESFISEVLDHVQATMFVNPATGLLTLKLVRADYDANTLPILNPDNAVLLDFQRKAWGETVNEIVTTWTNPDNEGEETVTMQDLGNIAAQGDVNSDSRNYYGIRNRDLAMQVTARDIRTAAAPLSSVEITVNRLAWDFLPGGCFKLVWPDEGINGIVYRIGNIKYGKPGDPSIRINAVEDIFSLTAGAYVVPPGTAWVDPASDPAPMTHTQIITLNAYFAANILSVGDANSLEFPEVFVGVLAAQNDMDTNSYDLYRQETLTNGDLQWVNQGTKTLVGRGVSLVGFAQEAVSFLPNLPAPSRGSGPEVAGLMFIGTGGDAGMEIALINSYDPINGWELHRGVLDTIPKAWPVGTPVWYVTPDSQISDGDILAAGTTVEYKLLTQTSRGILPLASAPTISAVLTGRPHLPSRPANVRINGVAFGDVTMAGTPTGFISVTWANRNRTTETTQILRWDSGTVVAETGQETVICVRNASNVIIQQYVSTGTSFNIPLVDLSGATPVTVEVLSRRDGLESLQAMRRGVTINW